MANRTSHRSRHCREHERLWRDRCVDRNLEDGWLESLNALTSLELISICEGHATPGHNRLRGRPGINLRLKASLLPQALKLWDTLSSTLEATLRRLFAGESTSAIVELKLEIRLRRSGSGIRHKLTARIEAREPRAVAEMDAETNDWFRNVVRSIQDLDSLLHSELATGTGREPGQTTGCQGPSACCE